MFSFNPTRKRSLPQRILVAAALLFFAVSIFIFTGCPMTDDSSGGGPGFDTRLAGTWEMTYVGGGERNVITDTTYAYGSTDADGNFTDVFAGELVYAYRFSDEAGIIIIEYTTGHKQLWSDYSDYPNVSLLDPQPAGNFYGIYYNNLTGGDPGDTVYLSNTSDQDNGNGPTEEETLAAAKAKFTLGNMNKYIALDGTSPQTKQ
jgi:hypothetical protein